MELYVEKDPEKVLHTEEGSIESFKVDLWIGLVILRFMPMVTERGNLGTVCHGHSNALLIRLRKSCYKLEGIPIHHGSNQLSFVTMVCSSRAP